MKNILKLSIAALIPLVFWACADDLKLERSDFFVSFRTYNGIFASANPIEGDTVTLTVSIGATRGSAVTVDFEVQLPEAPNAESKAYQLLDMNNNPLTSPQLTFPEGTGTQKFKFVATDNEISDGSRVFTVAITGNSAGYNIGIGNKGEASKFPITVKDDEVQLLIEELLGTWQVEEDWYVSSWTDGITYNVTFEQVDDTTLSIIGWGGEDDVVLTATVDLLSKTKTITIPFQNIHVDWDPGYDVYFTYNEAASGKWGQGFKVTLEKEDDGSIHFSLGSYTWEFAAAEEGDDEWQGFYVLAYGTTLTKLP